MYIHKYIYIHTFIYIRILKGQGGGGEDLGDVVMALFETQTRETKGRLASAAVLLGQLYTHLVQNCAVVAVERGEE